MGSLDLSGREPEGREKLVSLVGGPSMSCPCFCRYVRVWSSGSCSSRQGMVCHGGTVPIMGCHDDTVQVVVVHQLSCAACENSVSHGLCLVTCCPAETSWRCHAERGAVLCGLPTLLVAATLP
jgi:hypothetical protein